FIALQDQVSGVYVDSICNVMNERTTERPGDYKPVKVQKGTKAVLLYDANVMIYDSSRPLREERIPQIEWESLPTGIHSWLRLFQKSLLQVESYQFLPGLRLKLIPVSSSAIPCPAENKQIVILITSDKNIWLTNKVLL